MDVGSGALFGRSVEVVISKDVHDIDAVALDMISVFKVRRSFDDQTPTTLSVTFLISGNPHIRSREVGHNAEVVTLALEHHRAGKHRLAEAWQQPID